MKRRDLPPRGGRARFGLETSGLFDIFFDIRTNVSELLRNFPKVRRAALAGERVVIHTREGNLVLMAEKPAGRSLFGVLANTVDSKALAETDSGGAAPDWEPAL